MGSNGNGNAPALRFGIFDVDLRTQELRKQGTRVKLPRQSFQVLQMLLERSGELVTREELQKALWPADTFVDFDHGLNNAVKRIRAALGDSAETPHWIETLPRLGYRFVGVVNVANNGHFEHPQENGFASSFPASIPVPPTATRKIAEGRSRRMRWLLGAVGALAVFAVAAWGYHRFHAMATSADTLQLIPFTSYPGYEFAPTFSPDGNQIAFSWTGGESSDLFDLYVKVVGTETPVPLTHTPAEVMIPAWSPDGRFIAFSRYRLNSPEQSGVFLIPAVGGPERKIAQLESAKMMHEGGISWSPDSQSVIFPEEERSEFSAHLVLVDIDSLEKRVLPKPNSRCAAVLLPQFSPDGRSLAYTCMFSFGLGSLYVQPWPTGEARDLLEAKGDFAGLAWAVNGQSLVYTLNGNLWRLAIRHGAAPERLWYGQNAYAPAISRAKPRLAFTHLEDAVDIWRIPIARPGENTRPATRVIPSEVSQQNAQYSPDGKRFAFESQRSGSSEVWVCNADGSNLLKLTSFGGPLTGTPRWSPDGQRIVLDSRASGRPELYIVGADGGTPTLLRTTPAGGSVPYWSHDGRWIYFSTDVEGDSQIFKIAVEGGTPVQLTHQGGFVARESADGTRLYYTKMHSKAEFWSVGTDGSGEARVEDLPEFAVPAWDLTRDGIYFYDAMPRNRDILYYDFATRRTRRALQTAAPFAPFVVNLSVSPDGKDILYTQLGRSTADILLVDGFR